MTQATPQSAPAGRRPARPFTKYLVLYLVLTIGSVWALTIFFLADFDLATRVVGDLQLTNPLVVVILHSPAIAALLIFFLYDGWRGVANFFRSLVPRRRDWIWIPVLALIMLGYIFAVRGIAMLAGVPVPPDPLPPLPGLLTFLSMFVMEIGMVAITIGWFGFFLPFMHRITKSHLAAGVATGVGIGVFVAPGNLFSSFELATAWPLYVAQLCVLCTGMSLLLSRMKGNVLFFLVPFWVSASGSWLNLYYFNTPTQVVQLVLFGALVLVLHRTLSRSAGGLDPRFTFPEYLEHDYTAGMGAVPPGHGNRSAELMAASTPSAGAESVGRRR
ncbi:MAG: hypothetical protein QM582_11345 [Micropruina sp.]|uniref:hypothetical protein n=1 Tax=Micropruina sp. TaxID=2737536 RepID=UPI0039E4EB81